MRADSLGMFWQDETSIRRMDREKKVKFKPTPPEKFWLEDDYLPEIIEHKIEYLTDQDLINECGNNFAFDIECFLNYFLLLFFSFQSEKIIYFEKSDLKNDFSNNKKLNWILDNFCLIGYNSNNYDLTMLSLALKNKSCEVLKQATNKLIVDKIPPYEVLKFYKIKKLKLNTIDVMPLCPPRVSLKLCAGRLGIRRLQDLPFDPDKNLNENKIKIVRDYCVNDCLSTQEIFNNFKPQIDLRISLSEKYNIDLRSRSDAQIAEDVIKKEVEKITGNKIERRLTTQQKIYKYFTPDFINFNSELLNNLKHRLKIADFVLNAEGKFETPKILQNFELKIGETNYTFGLGGLHSKEKNISYQETENYALVDFDVSSYYPSIILNLGLFPDQLGKTFLQVYKTIVDTRLQAKKEKNKIVADCLKIVINGSFGKFGSMYSSLFSPQLLIQVTITGQLFLLMLIEKIENSGFKIISANTDGIVIFYEKNRKEILNNLIKKIETEIGFESERTDYNAYFARDVNNYVAIKGKESKVKGIFNKISIAKNPNNYVCVEALVNNLLFGQSIEETIKKCTDINKFLTLRTVTGGAVKDKIYLGKVVRFYYAEEEKGTIIYAKNGNKVPRSEGAKPLQDLSLGFPQDLDYDWYITEAEDLLGQIKNEH